jgi:hypothetical protein
MVVIIPIDYNEIYRRLSQTVRVTQGDGNAHSGIATCRPDPGRNDVRRRRGGRSDDHQHHARLHRHLVGSTFDDASALYAGSYGATAFSDYNWSLSLYSNAADLTYNSGVGVTISPSTAPSPPYTSPEPLLISGNGMLGYWGWSYNTAAGGGFPTSYGRLGNPATLNLDLGGFDDSGQTIGYYVFTYLPGNWTTEGTAPGDYIFNSVADGFSTPTFTYNAATNTTTVETYDPGHLGQGGGPNLSVTRVGSAVPEPSTRAMMFAGFAGLAFVAARSAKRRAVAA